jgi:NAD(P)-dependent dehydrogenase (short-subunit alcohol dehydrogenase family)
LTYEDCFREKTVFVTGGAHGIGLASAQAFGRCGARVCLFDRDEGALEEAIADLAGHGIEIMSLAGDVRDRHAVASAVESCSRRFGDIDVLINNAGVVRSTHVLSITDEDWRDLISINLTGMFIVGQTVATTMVRRQAGVILNTSSSGGIAGEPGHVHYEASKAGILGLTRSMAADLAPHRVRVCAICPGQVDTYSWDNVELQRMYEAKIPIGRSANPHEIAATQLFLASDDAGNMNGVVMIADGGMLAWE